MNYDWMNYKIWGWVISLVSIYFFYQYNFVIAVIVLMLGIWVLIGNNIGEYLDIEEKEKNCNFSIQFDIDILEVFKHDIFNRIFDQLKISGKTDCANKEEWINSLLIKYGNKHQDSLNFERDNGEMTENVSFNIKNNIIWKNDEVFFKDDIEHDFYFLNNDKATKSFSNNLKDGIILRLIIIDGYLRLQIIDSSSAPNSVCTITQFPLFCYTWRGLPAKYLNYFVPLASERKDCKGLRKDFEEYNYLLGHGLTNAKAREIATNFSTKAEKDIESQNFTKDSNSLKYWNFHNSFLGIYIADYNGFKQDRNDYDCF